MNRDIILGILANLAQLAIYLVLGIGSILLLNA